MAEFFGSKIKVLFLLFGLVFAQYAVANVKVISKMDSSVLLMGKQTIIHLEVIQDVAQKGQIVNEPKLKDSISYLVDGIEYAGIVRNDSNVIDNNKVQINKDYLIQSFDSGLYTIPPFKYVIGIDTFKSQPLTLKVLPLQVDSIYETITDFAPIEQVNRKLLDYIPDEITDNYIVILIIIALVLCLIALIYLYNRHKKSKPIHKKEIPPYDLALMQLTALNELHLCEKGEEKEFYTQLTDILREYLTKRFGINAMEMTSTQIIGAVKRNTEANCSKTYIEDVLEIADFVKFAKVRPLPEGNIHSYNAALQFVQNTKPVIVEVKEDSESTKL